MILRVIYNESILVAKVWDGSTHQVSSQEWNWVQVPSSIDVLVQTQTPPFPNERERQELMYENQSVGLIRLVLGRSFRYMVMALVLGTSGANYSSQTAEVVPRTR